MGGFCFLTKSYKSKKIVQDIETKYIKRIYIIRDSLGGGKWYFFFFFFDLKVFKFILWEYLLIEIFLVLLDFFSISLKNKKLNQVKM